MSRGIAFEKVIAIEVVDGFYGKAPIWMGAVRWKTMRVFSRI